VPAQTRATKKATKNRDLGGGIEAAAGNLSLKMGGGE